MQPYLARVTQTCYAGNIDERDCTMYTLETGDVVIVVCMSLSNDRNHCGCYNFYVIRHNTPMYMYVPMSDEDTIDVFLKRI